MSYRVDTERGVAGNGSCQGHRGRGAEGPVGDARPGMLLPKTGRPKATLVAGAGQAWVCGLGASAARPERRGGTALLSIRARRPIRRRPRPTPSRERGRRGPAAAARSGQPGSARRAARPATGFDLRARGPLTPSPLSPAASRAALEERG